MGKYTGKYCHEMPARRFSATSAPLTVDVLDGILESMVITCRNSHRKETGGILVGRYSKKGTTAEILEAFSPPVDSVGTTSTFHRGTSGLSKELTSRWAETGSHYVGEWHYHPTGNGQPSYRDINQMIDFAREEDMQSPVPIMMIVFPSECDQYEMRVFLFTQDGRTLELNSTLEKQGEGQ